MVLPAAWKISIEPVLVELFPEIAEDQPLKTSAICSANCCVSALVVSANSLTAVACI